MTTYPNQKIIVIDKAKCDNENIYGTVNKDCMYKAMQELTYNEFKLYMYFVTNQPGYTFALSPKYISERTGANTRETQRCINTLINKKYLVAESKNKYIFREEAKENYICSKTTQSKEDLTCSNTTYQCVEKLHPTCSNTTQYSGEKLHRNSTNNNTNNITEKSKDFSPCGEHIKEDDFMLLKKDATNLFFKVRNKDIKILNILLDDCGITSNTKTWNKDNCQEFIQSFYHLCPDLFDNDINLQESEVNYFDNYKSELLDDEEIEYEYPFS